MLKQHLFSVLLLTVLTATPVIAAPAIEEIIIKANNVSYYGGDDGRSEVAMAITDKQGRTRKRLFTILRKDVQDGGNQFYFVYFKRPSDVRKTTFLVHKHIDRDDDRWMYLPALDLVKRIAASDKRTSFMGSHFFYEDVSGRNMNDDHHELTLEDDVYYVIKNTPKNPESVEFASYTVWIDKKTYLPMKAEYVDKTGTVYRTMEVLKTKSIQGYTTVTKSRISDLGTGGNTVSEFSKIKYNLNLDDNLFSERYLRRPPREARQ